jgi:hypothetical protein
VDIRLLGHGLLASILMSPEGEDEVSFSLSLGGKIERVDFCGVFVGVGGGGSGGDIGAYVTCYGGA